MPLQPKAKSAYRDGVSNPANTRGELFARLIRDGRSRIGISQDELAERAGLNRSTVIRWESGETSRPEPEQVRVVCRALNIDPRRAAVALGFLTEEEAGFAPPPTLDPRIEEVLQLLEGGQLPPHEVDQWIDYLKFMQVRAQQERQKPAS